MGVIAASIPLFFLLIGVELAFARLRGRPLFRLNDSVADLALGITSQLGGIFTKIIAVGIYAGVWKLLRVQHWAPFPEWAAGAPVTFTGGVEVHGPALAAWSVSFVLIDFAYYWTHRLSHEIHILWAGHVVHHSSEEYNLTVALRQSALHGLFTWVFYLPIAFLGVPVAMFVTNYALNLLYQFWIHTRAIDRFHPWIEAVWNTPSHHRVHHGVNPKYQDKNYAGVFITFDKWFGTWVPEEEEPVYGITKPLESFNPVWANVHVFAEIGRLLRLTPRWRDKWRVVFGSPSWRPPEAGAPIVAPEVSRATFQQYDPPVPRPVAAYAFVQFLVALTGAYLLLTAGNQVPLVQLGAASFYVVLALSNLGVLLEGRAWVLVPELARHAVLAVVCIVAAGVGAWGWTPALVATAGCIASAAWLVALRPRLENDAAPGDHSPGAALLA
ncbi:MAG: sterol desaturase family protein [Gemmatimonadetes bacterium]|nr:sterol desaturase family protein [Gemmatimonadota bacterium]